MQNLFSFPTVANLKLIRSLAEFRRVLRFMTLLLMMELGMSFGSALARKKTKESRNFFWKVPCFYVADGHHRTAAAARVGQRRKDNNPNHTGDEEYNFFMTVAFPDNQLKIFDYNRVVKDLNGMTEDDFINELSKSFHLEKADFSSIKPAKIREFAMYLSGQWYRMSPKSIHVSEDPVADLDVTILSELILQPILQIGDLRKSERIDFVGGISGLEELSNGLIQGRWP